ncbi:hypothetical protein CJF32_00004710 [Rutstroemia sp. NJR-2017a WRK4]|nr:hypothetical protein CJF32_00004710 [Rutstroemia sp. NJR-2017a WRK4]
MSAEEGTERPLFFPPVRGSPHEPPSPRDPPGPIPIPDLNFPSVDWLPIYNIRTPYDEAEIVHLIHEIVRNFVRLSGVSENDVLWPPEDGHPIDEGVCNELNISAEAKSLIRHSGTLRVSRESPSYDPDKDSLGDRYILP